MTWEVFIKCQSKESADLLAEDIQTYIKPGMVQVRETVGGAE